MNLLFYHSSIYISPPFINWRNFSLLIIGIEVISDLPQKCQTEISDKNGNMEDVIINSNTSYFENYDIIIDSFFGFSFSGVPREPYKSIIKSLASIDKVKSKVKILSVDIPSGNCYIF